MLRLNLQKSLYWIELSADVKVRVHPLSTAIMSAAQSSVIQQITHMREARRLQFEAGADVSELPDVDDEHTRMGITEALLIKALARGAIVEWTGVMQADGNGLAEITQQSIEELMDIWFIAQDFWKQYTNSLSVLEAEGNAFELAANGTSAVGLAIAPHALRKPSRAAKAKKTN